MTRTTKVWLAFILVAFFVSGCSGEKGDGFVGKWVGQNNERIYKPSYVMVITRDGDNFHVDVASTQDLGFGKPVTTNKQFEAQAESDTVLSMLGGMATMRLEKGIISFDGTSFTKSS